MGPRPCSVCGELVADRGGSRSRAYCSEVCRWADRPTPTCPGCGSTFQSKDRKAIYCSQRCREAGRRAPGVEVARLRRQAVEAERQRKVDERAAARVVPARPCRECGVVFVPGRRTGVFHDAVCRDRSGRHREGVIEHRRRGKLVRRHFRAAVYERDHSRCYLCRQVIDVTIPFPDPRSPSIDHVMPYSAGGSDELANLRAAHLGCNIEKGDRLPYWWERSA